MSIADDALQQKLYQLLQAGDPEALEVLYEYAARIEHGIRWKFGVYLSQEDLEDIVSDTLLHAFEKGHQFNPEIASIATWLNMRAHYETLTFLRKRLRPNTLNELGHSLALEAENAHRGLPSEPAMPSPQMAKRLEMLTPRRGEVIELLHYQGYSVDHIAKVLNISTGAVRVHLHRAYRDLRGIIENEQETDEDE